MKVILSGYNLDRETLNEIREFIKQVAEQPEEPSREHPDPAELNRRLQQLYSAARELYTRDNLTPETLSAAYARISRNPKPVNELREIARREVDKARKSNQNIIFGLGHSSVAEHAVFNFDTIGVSRLAVEAIEKFRLASYTEKSQRYILFKDDYTIPPELENSHLKKAYISLIRRQNETYYQLYEKLRPYFFKKYPDLAADKKNHRRLKGLAKEDARYVISLATQTQLGMTVNARSLENMIAKCGAHPLAEVREYGQKLYKATEGYAPSLIKYVEPTDYLRHKNRDLQNFLKSISAHLPFPQKNSEPEVRLLNSPQNADNYILAAILFRLGKTDFKTALHSVDSFPDHVRRDFFRTVFHQINPWDSLLRDFEFVSLTFQLIVSASNFGQLKRHRMANLTAQNYDPALGTTVPDSIIETGQEEIFHTVIDETNRLYQQILQESPEAAPYVLTNSHRRRVLFKINLREFYHFNRLREDSHAQWDIRRTATKMHELLNEKLPLSGALLCGKDQFSAKYRKFYNE